MLRTGTRVVAGPAEAFPVDAAAAVETDALAAEERALERGAVMADGDLAVAIDDAPPGDVGPLGQRIEGMTDAAGGAGLSEHGGDSAVGDDAAGGHATHEPVDAVGEREHGER